MTRKNIDRIIEILDGKKDKIAFKQFKSCKAWVSVEVAVEAGVGDDYISTIVVGIMSYDTIVGFVDVCNHKVYEYGKYTPTTSKQFTQICNAWYRGYDRVFIDVPTYNRFTKKDWGC